MIRVEKTALVDALGTENGALDAKLESIQDQLATLIDALDTPDLQADSYTAIAARIRDFRIPVLHAHHVAFEAICSANDANRSMASGLPDTSPGVYDQDELQRTIQDLQGQIMRWQALGEEQARNALMFDSPYTYSYDSLISVNQGAIASLMAKMQVGNDYARDSATLYGNIKTTINDTLGAANASISTYLKTGSYGNMGWAAEVGKVFDSALTRHADKALLALSAENPGKAFLSPDKRHIFYKGEKIEIYDPQKYLEEGDGKGAIRAIFSEVGCVIIDGKLILDIGKLFTGVSLADPKMGSADDKGDLARKRYSRLMAGAVATEGLTDALESLNRVRVRLSIESDGASRRVVIQAGSVADWQTIRAKCGVGRDGGGVISSDPSYPIVLDQARQAYEQATGNPSDENHDYRVVYHPDPARLRFEDDSRCAYVLYYDDSGNLMRVPRSFENDRYEIVVTDHKNPKNSTTIDVPGQPYPTTPTPAPDDYKAVMGQLG